MAQRTTRIETFLYVDLPLKSAVVAEQGNIACIDTADGALVGVSTATTLIPIGVFDEGMNFTGNGTTKARVKLFKEIRAARFLNDTGTAVTAAQRLQLCYLKDGATVSGDSTGRSVAGRVWDVSSTLGVLVEFGTTSDLVDNT